MKAKIFLLIFTISTCFSMAQKIDECYVNTKTGDTLVSTLWYNAEYSETSMLSFRLVHHNSDFFLELKYNFGKGPSFWITKNDSVWLKFTDGLTFTVYATDSVHSRRAMSASPGSFKGMTTQGIYAVYRLSFMQLMILQSQNVDKVRIFSSHGFDNIILSRADRKTMLQYAAMITQRVDKYQLISVASDQKKANDDEKKQDDW
jgi:hypothetical protein